MSGATCQRRLEGKVAIVTGGASGIGETTSRLFADRGALAVVIADIQVEQGERVAASIGHGRCTFMHCDVTNEDQVKSVVDSTVQKYGHLDIMFSNAGVVNRNQGILDLDLHALDDLFAVNVRGMAVCVKHAGRVMVDGGVKGSIVCTGSAAASVGGETHIDYIMSKHAVLGLVRSACRGLGKYGIRVNCVSPSALVTPMMCNLLELDEEGVENAYSHRSSLEGRVLKASNVADAVLFLASDESAFVSGHNLAVDGGYLNR
ncbi:short-chain dehydrogenase reductase 3b-like isoform X2 [Tasmannia lanceolata]|uniref:short-chain dehydrogenase reductase 3b-like isoform X2 n=1 Tax=Tasmannia lanceolata TaxID=3420 RepID=UPI004064AC35